MNTSLRYLPAYLGLFAAQALALICNAFLDIQYGGFAVEVMLWTVAIALTLRVGWRQGGEVTELGKRWMRRMLFLGALLTALIFIPMWGFPRAGLYMLAMLMVSYNCITTARRHLHLGLLISLIMVMFVATHYRADWTMLFYLVPYVAAVVFALVAEQINRKADELRQQSLGHQVVGAQGTAIAAATVVILALGLLLYALTPQVTWMSTSWRFGQPAGFSMGDGKLQTGNGEGESGGAAGEGGGGASGSGSGGGSLRPGWPSPAEMREAAARKGMPEWQRDVINGMADLTEGLGSALKPVKQRVEALWDAIKEWLKNHRDKIAQALSALGLLVLLYALYKLMREARAATWLRTRFDYVRLVLLGMHGSDADGARTYYGAMVRLFKLHDIERDGHENTREFLAEIHSFYRDLRQETGEITRHFEDARYGGLARPGQVESMRNLYRQIFQRVAQ
jgi:hypothetical protein